MATTTNFGWETPDDTDLVKDGAAAMRTLGNSIDTSMADLKGGTTGQVLSKASNTDMDFTWIAQDDSNAIQNAIVDAKGDLISATAADTPARLAVGTNGQVLTADSSTATGLKWANAGVTFSGVSCYDPTTSLSNGVTTAINWASEFFDTDGYHSTTTNTNRITIPSGKAGKFLVSINIFYAAGNGQKELYVRKNGSAFRRYDINSSTIFNQNISDIYDLAVGDYINIEIYQATGGTVSLSNGTQVSNFNLTYLGA